MKTISEILGSRVGTYIKANRPELNGGESLLSYSFGPRDGWEADQRGSIRIGRIHSLDLFESTSLGVYLEILQDEANKVSVSVEHVSFSPAHGPIDTVAKLRVDNVNTESPEFKEVIKVFLGGILPKDVRGRKLLAPLGMVVVEKAPIETTGMLYLKGSNAYVEPSLLAE
jgi:hypothetical protein